MAVEYDLIVIGNTPGGIYAAVAATALNARIALITQNTSFAWNPVYSRTLLKTTRLVQQWEKAQGVEVSPELQTEETQWNKALKWAKEVCLTLSEQQSPAILSSLGIDVIEGKGEFVRLPSLGFVVNNRKLRSRSYLIATGSSFKRPNTIDYLTPTELWQQSSAPSLPSRLIVFGGTPISVELAQSLARLEHEITLVVGNPKLLPTEDRETSQLIQYQLEAEGVKILTESPVTQVRVIEGKKWVQAGNEAIETDEIIVADEREPNIAGLNLEGVGVECSSKGIIINSKLQTTNPQIYACGDVAGGYPFSHLAQYEASIALKNALFLPFFKVDYQSIPWAIFTQPQLARVGMTESQAIERYGKDICIVKHYYKQIPQAQIIGKTTGFCKLIVRGNGQILGAHIVGEDATELIGAIAILIQNKIKLGAIAKIPLPSPTLSEILSQTAIEWQRERLRRNKTLQNALETWLSFRRKLSQ